MVSPYSTKAILTYLDEHGIKNPWLADKVNIKYKTLFGKFQRGSIEADELLKIAKVLNIDLNSLRDQIEL
jgi:hypothetical protein